jgi:type IV secretion system protein VirB10
MGWPQELVMGTTEHEPSPPPKVDPDSVALRAAPRPVTRLNRRTLAVSASVLAVTIAVASMWALQSKHGRRGQADSSEQYNVDRVAKADDLDQLPADYSKLPAKPAPAPAASVPPLGPPLPGDWGAASALQAPVNGGLNVNRAPSAENIDRQREAEQVARSSVFFRTAGNADRPDAAATIGQVLAAPNASGGPFNPAGTGPASTVSQPNDPTAIQNRQGEKEAFLANSGDTATRNAGALQSPASPYTVMAGTVIPAALVTGINSDLPGQVIAEVTQPVYDTATGRYLLIPQGSRLIGRYDSQVAFGQRRVLLVWLRLILPDASSVALDKLPGIDPAGYAGLEDGVDWHWGRILAGAALSTMLGVSSELAVSNEGDINGNTVLALRDSAQDTANQVGQEITRRNLSVQPTLTVRPGFPMDVMVGKDLVLRPYQPLFVQPGPMP